MVSGLLFHWEDSQALQHHCGFCERPLSHPGARASCFGTHSEPCHRFHQAMFMRNRAHICAYCSTVDEAHYRRHHELVEQLRSIYESCGEVDWTIVPAEPGDPRRGRAVDLRSAGSKSSDHNLTPEEPLTSKRERKDAKCLVRAASRARVVTQEDIRYVDSVLHCAESVFNGDSAGPANLEEMQMIETNLRYNAHVYNSHSSQRALKRFANIPDVDVDFDSEMERILDTFRITELVKCNLRNRGLQGKGLKTFEILVEAFKNTIVEDLVLVKKDMMEIRMRRAGYLRYTSKTAYGIVEDRYTDKDWKTGERITFSSSESSGLTSPTEELVTSQSERSDTITWPVPPSVQEPDRRHLQHIHTRVNGDDGIGQKVIEPYHAPLLPLTPVNTLRRSAVLQLKVIGDKENSVPVALTNREWLRQNVARQKPFSQPLRPLEKVESASPQPTGSKPTIKPGASARPAWGVTISANSLTPVKQVTMSKYLKVDECEYPAIKSAVESSKLTPMRSDAPAVHRPREEGVISFRGPERTLTSDEKPEIAHPIVSQKKAKKLQREAKRKAKKVSDPEAASSPTAEEEISLEKPEQDLHDFSLSESQVNDAPDARNEMLLHSYVSGVISLIDCEKGLHHTNEHIVMDKQIAKPDILTVVSPTSLPCTTHSRHDHWMRFTRNFVVDQLTVPLLQSFEGCSHGSSCLFESTGLQDCPFHEPHCSCVDPLRNQCYVMHPGKQMCSSGPYNRAYGERLMAMYEQHERTRGRLMLVDEDVVTYFMDDTNTPSKPDHASMPARLLWEHIEFLEGYERGPLMKQEFEFDQLFVKNVAIKHPITMRMLLDIQCHSNGRKDTLKLCYCYTEVQNLSEVGKEFSKGFVRCSYGKCEFGGIFHKRCVKKLGVEKVSRWYCTACEREMKILACKTLEIPPVKNKTIMDRAEKMVIEMMKNPGGAMDRFKVRLQELYDNGICDELDVK